MSAFSSDVHYRRLPRSARHLARMLLRRGTAHQRASSVRAAGNALGYAVEVEHNPNAAVPVGGGDAPGQRVRLGRETRDLLKRLLASRNRLHQVALVREIRHQISQRIALHQRRSARIRSARARSRAAGRMTLAWGGAVRSQGGQLAQRVRAARTAPAAALPSSPAAPPVPRRARRGWRASRAVRP